ncbi:NAD(P)H-binding protein [Nonomuraea sp. NBC_01738]|uniref:NAD(P)-dependent oxidoreductase n=1 Tax=Nonomuraea sp. NBC_01738 TaxID=2976003 RepID=UPI002E141814|nr:NAD(P)H-binding protein [Nonomuraea sp. NBC_01738]
MNILLIGANGMIGSRVAEEARNRGHQVTGVSRSGSGGTEAADGADPKAVAALAAGKDAVVLAVSPPRDGSDPVGPLLAAGRGAIEGARAAGVKRLIVVGGAGSLEVAPGARLVDQPEFPALYKAESLAQADLLDLVRANGDDLDWTYISPAPEIEPGERTGSYRKGYDQVIGDRISAEDYAVALVDELENNTANGRRMTVAN